MPPPRRAGEDALHKELAKARDEAHTAKEEAAAALRDALQAGGQAAAAADALERLAARVRGTRAVLLDGVPALAPSAAPSLFATPAAGLEFLGTTPFSTRAL